MVPTTWPRSLMPVAMLVALAGGVSRTSLPSRHSAASVLAPSALLVKPTTSPRSLIAAARGCRHRDRAGPC